MDDQVDFKTGYLSDPDDLDLKAQVWAYKKQRRITRGMRFFGGELDGQYPAFPEDSKASSVPAAKTGNNDLATDIEVTHPGRTRSSRNFSVCRLAVMLKSRPLHRIVWLRTGESHVYDSAS